MWSVPLLHWFLLSLKQFLRKDWLLKNVVMRLEGERKTKLVIEVDLAEEYGLSSSGKSITIAGTEGAVSVPDHEEMKINLNVYKPRR